MIGSSQPKVLAELYTKIFDKKPDSEEGGWYGWQVGSCYLSIGEHSEVHDSSKEPQRVMFCLETDNVKEEFERIKKYGATVIKEPYDMEGYEGYYIATFADPDGNYFQLMSKWD